MITLYQFNQLSENEKADTAWTGAYLGNRTEEDHIVQLYSLPDFYVEVYYSPGTNAITRFRAFKQLRLLAPYLEQTKTLYQ